MVVDSGTASDPVGPDGVVDGSVDVEAKSTVGVDHRHRLPRIQPNKTGNSYKQTHPLHPPHRRSDYDNGVEVSWIGTEVSWIGTVVELLGDAAQKATPIGVTILGIVVQLLGSLLTITVAPSTPACRRWSRHRRRTQLAAPGRSVPDSASGRFDAEPTERPTGPGFGRQLLDSSDGRGYALRLSSTYCWRSPGGSARRARGRWRERVDRERQAGSVQPVADRAGGSAALQVGGDGRNTLAGIEPPRHLVEIGHAPHEWSVAARGLPLGCRPMSSPPPPPPGWHDDPGDPACVAVLGRRTVD